MGCKIFHGPYIYNFQEVYDLLKSYGVAEKVNNELELSKKIIKNLEGAKISNYKQIDLLNTYGEKILNETAVSLNMYLK